MKTPSSRSSRPTLLDCLLFTKSRPSAIPHTFSDSLCWDTLFRPYRSSLVLYAYRLNLSPHLSFPVGLSVLSLHHWSCLCLIWPSLHPNRCATPPVSLIRLTSMTFMESQLRSPTTSPWGISSTTRMTLSLLMYVSSYLIIVLDLYWPIPVQSLLSVSL